MKKERAARPQHATDEQIQDVNYWLEKTPEERLRAMLEINKRYNDLQYGSPGQPLWHAVEFDDENAQRSLPMCFERNGLGTAKCWQNQPQALFCKAPEGRNVGDGFRRTNIPPLWG